MKLVSKKIFHSLHKSVEKSYQKKVKLILEYNKSNPVLPKHFIEYFKKEINKNFHPLKFYFLTLIDDYLTILELEQDQAYDEIFDFWSESEFAPLLFKSLKKSKNNMVKSCDEITKIFIQQIELFFTLHILGKPLKSNSKYRLVFEIGDHLVGNKVKSFEFGELKSIELDNGYYPFVSFLCQDEKNKKYFLKRIAKALDILKTYSPESYLSFTFFTHSIIPIKDKKIVSYSSQKLPGYSVINLYHRDFIDLLDDLLHENGHHHLNYYLNHTHLIYEDNDKIFYSPWRKQLRPIRGIYHATFTFYWAFVLFKDLAIGLENDKINYYKFTKKQIYKIHFRFLEEYLMLTYSYDDLIVALQMGKITKKGFNLISLIKKELIKSEPTVQRSIKYLKNNSDSYYKNFLKLKNELTSARKHYGFKH